MDFLVFQKIMKIEEFMKKISILFVSACMFFSILNYSFSQESEKINKDLLVEDTRQLARILESAHPDPYIRGGGKIAFHRRLQNLLSSIPAEGMKKIEFYNLLASLCSCIT